MEVASTAVDAYVAEGLVAFSVDIRWDLAAKRGVGGKKSVHPKAWQTAGGAKRPDWNSVAINTGLSMIVVIDFDSDESLAAFRAEAARRGVDVTTREAKSGSGRGGHLYFRVSPGATPLRSLDNVPLWGIVDPSSGTSKIDVKAAGGLIYAPPSSYSMPDGSLRRYRWIDEAVGFAELPEALRVCLPVAGGGPSADRRPAPATAPPIAQATSQAIAPVTAPAIAHPGGREKPIDATEAFQLVAALAPERAASERTGDWLRVGFALKHNEMLLRNADKSHEADMMPTLFDLFSALCREKYHGHEAILKEFAGFRPDRPGDTAVTIATLVAMARVDSRKAASLTDSAGDSVKALVSARVGCSPSDVRISVSHEQPDGDGSAKRLDVATPSGSGYVDPVDLAMFIDPSRKEMLGASQDGDGSIQLPSDFASKAKKHFKEFKRGQLLEYHRDHRDVVGVRPRGANYSLA